MQVNLGVADAMSDSDGPVTYLLPASFKAGGFDHERITIHTKYYDPEAAPPGKSSVTVFLNSSYSWWRDISSDSVRYRDEKSKVAEKVIEAVTYFRPGFNKKVEIIDVSTPLTRERYTGNWMGAMQAWKPSSNMIGAILNRGSRYVFKGIKGYYMAGQWVEPWGGITTAAQSGRKAIALICRHEGKRFTTTIP
jgi:phytoene dehydrogenase-like protein